VNLFRPLRLLLAGAAALVALVSPAAEPRDLGQGLVYLRVHSIDASLPDLAKALAERDALVLDFRYATASAASVAGLRAALAARGQKPAAFVLVSPDTPPAVAAARETAPKAWLLLGVADSLPLPQVVVDQDAATDRRAYDALESGHDLAALISGRLGKERYDEASLMQEFRGGRTDAQPPAAPDPTAPKSGEEKAPVLTDRVLQRAVHLHRALLALKAR